MKKPKNPKVGDQFRVIEADNGFKFGEIISLERDDGTDRPYFSNADESIRHCMLFSELEPYLKTARDAQVGDVVIDEDGDERMVLERWQNTVLLSQIDNFKKIGCIFYFDKLEEDFTLKAEPVKQRIITMDQIAKKFGINISNLKITKD